MKFRHIYNALTDEKNELETRFKNKLTLLFNKSKNPFDEFDHLLTFDYYSSSFDPDEMEQPNYKMNRVLFDSMDKESRYKNDLVVKETFDFLLKKSAFYLFYFPYKDHGIYTINKPMDYRLANIDLFYVENGLILDDPFLCKTILAFDENDKELTISTGTRKTSNSTNPSNPRFIHLYIEELGFIKPITLNKSPRDYLRGEKYQRLFDRWDKNPYYTKEIIPDIFWQISSIYQSGNKGIVECPYVNESNMSELKPRKTIKRVQFDFEPGFYFMTNLDLTDVLFFFRKYNNKINMVELKRINLGRI